VAAQAAQARASAMSLSPVSLLAELSAADGVLTVTDARKASRAAYKGAISRRSRVGTANLLSDCELRAVVRTVAGYGKPQVPYTGR
jgi:hypothetical protein